MDIHTLQSLLDSNGQLAQLLTDTRKDEAFASGSDIDYNYVLGVEHGIRKAVRILKGALEAELNYRDNDTQWIDYVVRSALENNTFGDHCSWDGAYDEAAEELNVDHNTLRDAFDRVSDDIKNGRVRSVVQEAA